MNDITHVFVHMYVFASIYVGTLSLYIYIYMYTCISTYLKTCGCRYTHNLQLVNGHCGSVSPCFTIHNPPGTGLVAYVDPTSRSL